MNVMRKAAAVAVCALTLAANQAGAQPQNPNAKKMDIFAAAKVGQWAELSGPYQKDNTILAVKVKFVNGAILEDDYEVSGKVLSVDAAAQELKLVRQWSIKCQKDAEFKDKNGVAITFANIKPGMAVEAEGTYKKAEGFLAKEIEEDEVKEAEEADEISVFGKIEKVDASAKTIQVLGITFVVTEQTKGKTVMK